MRTVVEALWCSVKSHWREPEGEGGKKRGQVARDRLMERAEWMFVFLKAEK